MNFHDPGRRTINGSPCWLDSSIILPPLLVEPHPTDTSLLSITIFDGGRNHYLQRDITKVELHEFIHFWEHDPEGTFYHLFGLEWPHGHTAPQHSVKFNPQDVV